MRSKIILPCILAMCPMLAHAQAELVADFGSGGPGGPQGLTVCGDKLFFLGFSADTGYELWVTDGTLAGSHMVKDIDPGPPSGAYTGGRYIVAVGDKVYFQGHDADHGYELWISDGTEAGTMLVADIWPGPQDGLVSPLIGLSDRVIFSANDGSGVKLWCCSGTAVTQQTSFKLAMGVWSQVVADEAFFLAWSEQMYTYSLWRSTGFGATLVWGVYNPWGVGPYFAEFTPFNSGFYFVTSTEAEGMELWFTNGASESANIVADMLPGPYGLEPRSLLVMGDELYFVGLNGWDRVWYRLNGGLPVIVSPMTVITTNGIEPSAAMTLNDRILFMHDAPGTTGVELYTTDGTEAGTMLLKDIHPGPGSGVLSEWAGMYRVDDEIYFVGNTPTTGPEPWKTDGTAEGTVMVADIGSGPNGSMPHEFTRMGDHLYFSGSAYWQGRQLFRVPLSGHTAAEEVPVNDRPLVYPNPNNGTFRVQGRPNFIQAGSAYHLFDPQGREVPVQFLGATNEGTAHFRCIRAAHGPHVLRITNTKGAGMAVPVVIE